MYIYKMYVHTCVYIVMYILLKDMLEWWFHFIFYLGCFPYVSTILQA